MSQVRKDMEIYISVTNEQLSAESDFIKYEIAGTFALLACLISMWHIWGHLRHLGHFLTYLHPALFCFSSFLNHPCLSLPSIFLFSLCSNAKCPKKGLSHSMDGSHIYHHKLAVSRLPHSRAIPCSYPGLLRGIHGLHLCRFPDSGMERHIMIYLS